MERGQRALTPPAYRWWGPGSVRVGHPGCCPQSRGLWVCCRTSSPPAACRPDWLLWTAGPAGCALCRSVWTPERARQRNTHGMLELKALHRHPTRHVCLIKPSRQTKHGIWLHQTYCTDTQNSRFVLATHQEANLFHMAYRINPCFNNIVSMISHTGELRSENILNHKTKSLFTHQMYKYL